MSGTPNQPSGANGGGAPALQFRKRYSIHPVGLGRIRAIKLDRKTGQTWFFDIRGYWTVGTNASGGAE
jgi:hypothetical protein